MPSVDKIVDKMKRQPNGIKPTEVEKVLFFMDMSLENKEDHINDMKIKIRKIQ